MVLGCPKHVRVAETGQAAELCSTSHIEYACSVMLQVSNIPCWCLQRPGVLDADDDLKLGAVNVVPLELSTGGGHCVVMVIIW